jgi:hypothetical protein
MIYEPLPQYCGSRPIIHLMPIELGWEEKKVMTELVTNASRPERFLDINSILFRNFLKDSQVIGLLVS